VAFQATREVAFHKALENLEKVRNDTRFDPRRLRR
jgi:hypothetical protein